MKKTLVALAALAATAAFAQSTVTLTGSLDPSVTAISKTYNNETSATQTSVNKNQQGTENITFSGAEDLGGGMKAEFLYELDFVSNATGGAANAGAAPGAGQVFGGLSGRFGSIKLGTPNSPTLTVQGARSPFTTKTGGRAALVNTTLYGVAVTRQAGSIAYATPTFSGFSAAVSYAPGASTDTTGGVTATGDISDIGLFYANGPLSAGVAMYTNGSTATVGAETQTSLNVQYNFGPGTVYVGYHTRNNNKVAGSSTKDNGANLGASFTVAKGTDILFNYTTLNDDTTANKDQRMAGLGVKYTMSKRTSLYARYVTQTVDNTTAATEVKNAKATIFGIQHNF